MKRILALILVAMLTATVFVNTLITYSQRGGENKILVVIAPGYSPDLNANYTKTLQGLNNKSVRITIKDNSPYTLTYHELLLVNTTWDLGKAIPINNKLLMRNGTSLEIYKYLDNNNTLKIWGQLDTLFIMRIMDPSFHPRTINPYYQAENTTIPPEIFKIPFNGTARWKLLDTKLSIRRTEQGYVLKAENYFSIKVSNVSLSTPTIKINITKKNLGVKPGIYYINFRIVNVTEDYAIVFTPGTRLSSGWFSEYFGREYQNPVILDLPPASILSALGKDDIEWLMNEITTSYSDLLNFAYKYRGAIVDMIEFPLLEEAIKLRSASNISDAKYGEILNGAIKALSTVIESTRVSIGENITVILYSPYTIKKGGQSISGAAEIIPGLYNITGGIDQVIEEVGSGKVYAFHGSKVMATTNTYYTGYGNGLLMIYKPGLGLEQAPVNITLTPYSVAAYIASMVNGYGVGMNGLLRIIQKKDSEINQLKTTLNEKDSRIGQLNKQVEGLKKQIGNLTALNANLSIRISDLQKQIDQANKLKQEAYEYLLVGVSSIIVVILILYYMLHSAVAKRTTGKVRK